MDQAANQDSVYLIRHGQAGSRQKYDELSDLGREQARRLGAYLAERGARFVTLVADGLSRQQETARIVAGYLTLPGAPPPDVVVDPRWNEFDLDEVYAGLAPQLARDDAAFRAAYEKQQLQIEDAASPVHRRWTSCDVAVFMAWRDGQMAFEGESFAAFCARVEAAQASLRDLVKPAAIFTSATPVALVLGRLRNLSAVDAMQLAGAMFNSAWAEVTVSDVISVNNAPHLPVELRTTR